jgi:transcriptional regulator with XRE-family HTH domain
MPGSELRKLRVLAGQSQFQLAREARIDRTRISLCENGHVQLSPEEGKRVARVVLSAMQRKMAEVDAAISATETVA